MSNSTNTFGKLVCNIMKSFVDNYPLPTAKGRMEDFACSNKAAFTYHYLCIFFYFLLYIFFFVLLEGGITFLLLIDKGV